MALATPVWIQPIADEADLRLDERILFQWTKISGGGNFKYYRILFYSDSGGTTLVHDTLWQPTHAQRGGDGWATREASALGFTSATSYWRKVGVRDDAAATSSYSTLFKFTMETVKLSATNWEKAQP